MAGSTSDGRSSGASTVAIRTAPMYRSLTVRAGSSRRGATARVQECGLDSGHVDDPYRGCLDSADGDARRGRSGGCSGGGGGRSAGCPDRLPAGDGHSWTPRPGQTRAGRAERRARRCPARGCESGSQGAGRDNRRNGAPDAGGPRNPLDRARRGRNKARRADKDTDRPDRGAALHPGNWPPSVHSRGRDIRDRDANVWRHSGSRSG